MKKIYVHIFLVIFLSSNIYAQNVGVGTASPGSKLEIQDVSGDENTPGILRLTNTAGSSQLRMGVLDGNRSWIQSFGSIPLHLNRTGNNVILNETAGNVGIGIGSPASKLHIQGLSGDENAAGIMRLTNTAGSSQLRMGVLDGNRSWIQSFGSIPLHLNRTGNNVILNETAGNVGIGIASPAQKLHLNGNFRMDGVAVEGNASYRVYRNLATYNSSSPNAAGAFVIVTQQPWNSTCMFRVKLEGYFYNSTSTFEMTIGGYIFNNNQFYNTGYTTTGSQALQVRLGRNIATNTVAIVIGSETATYPYPKITVTSFMQGHNNINESHANGWTISQLTDLTGVVDYLITVPDVTRLNGLSATDFIQNQSAVDQTANFRISGTGRANTSFQSPVYTRADAGTVAIRPNTNSTTAIQLQNASGGSILNVDATNSRVGIGTTAPGHVLHVVETADNSAIAGIYINESNIGQALTIDEAGNGAGILLTANDLGAAIQSTAQGAVASSVSGHVLSDTRTSSTASITKTALAISSTGTWNGAGAINRGLTVEVSGGTTNYAALFTGGNVGIGTTTPTYVLEVHGLNAIGAINLSTGGSTNIRSLAHSWANHDAFVYSTTAHPAFVGMRGRGVHTSPTYPVANDILLELTGRDAIDGYSATNVGGAAIIMQATQNFSATAKGTNLILRTTPNNSATPLDRILIDHNGNVGVGINNPSERLEVLNNTYITGALVSQGFSVMEIDMVQNSNLGGPDNAYHTVTCPNGYAMINLSIYATNRLDGGERINCVKINDLITNTHTWRGHSGAVTSQGSATNTFGEGADNQTHSCSCNAGEVATGFEVYSTDRLDGRMKLRCTALKSGYSLANNTTETVNSHTVRGTMSAMNVPWNVGVDNQYHASSCPPGTFVTAVAIYAADRLDGELRCYCSGIKK